MSDANLKEKKKLLIFKNPGNSTLIGVAFLKWMFLGTAVGIFTGLVGAMFLKSLEVATNLRMNNPWLLFLLPFGGGFISFLYSRYGKNSLKGNNLILDKINQSSGNIPLRMAPLVFLGTFVTHLLGGSAGREGTGVQIGASISEAFGRVFKLDKIDVRIILMSGISSGFASVFGTPLAGTIFGLEVAALGTMNYEGLIPCFTAAFVANYVTEAFGIHHTHYKILGIPEITFAVVIKVVVAAILFGLVSKLFSELTHKIKEVFSKGFENTAIKSMVGGIIIIALTYILGTRDYLGLSLPLITDSFTKLVSPFDSLGKLIFTSLTLGTGFQGGEVTPLFVIGSTFGNALSRILNISPSFLAALGLIGVFAGATNTPITSFILGIEMFGSQYSQYMFMTCAISYLFSGHSGIYISQKISTSKSKLIQVPKEATLSYSRNKSKDNPSKSKHILVGQFKFGVSSIELPSIEGINIYKIASKGKGVKLVHHSYNPDGGNWSGKPINGQYEHIKLKGMDTEIHAITIGQRYGKKDKIFLINTNFWGSVEIDYVVEHSKNKERNLNNKFLNENRKETASLESNEMSKMLVGQFKIGKSHIELPNQKGKNKYIITVKNCTVRLNHNSYNPDGHTWSTPPGNGQKQHIDISKGTHTFEIFVGEYHGKNNKIYLVNGNIFKNVEVNYLVESVKNNVEVKYTVEQIDMEEELIEKD